jgi:4-amino-4-deoxy-L-arabinose transferase-like glycosyltransferase
VTDACANSPRWSSAGFSRGLWLLLLVGTVARLLYVGRPLDHRLLAPWRESDYTQVTRNFYRGDLNLFYPQIDWRGNTPGYAEMELPVVPWIGALLDRVFGYHEGVLRVLSSLFGILALLVFVVLSRQLLPPSEALFAVAAFALNPLLVALGNAMQPEPLMLFLSLVAMVFVCRWDDEPRFVTLLGAAALTACAILAKSPAAYLGMVLAYVVIRKLGRRAFTDIRVYCAAAIALLPPLVWYLWARHFWRVYGNSLGVSNESHFFGLDMLTPPRFLLGILKWETLGVFTPAGWLLALAGLVAVRGRGRVALVWYGAVWVFYLVTARTSGDDWSFYYHTIAVAPACLLMGAGFGALTNASAADGSAAVQRWAGWVLAGGTLVALVGLGAYLVHRRDSRADYQEMRRCALEYLQYVPPSERIVVNGGAMFDEYGKPVAHNESMFFAWMDRQGFNYGTEELSVATLDRLAARGARFWIVRRNELDRDDLQRLADARYRRIATCGGDYFLYDLHTAP